MAARGTAQAIAERTKDLQDQLQIDIQRCRPIAQRPGIQEIKAAQALSIRLESSSNRSEMRPFPPASRIDRSWPAGIFRHTRTLVANPDAADLVRVARIQALIASTTAVVGKAVAKVKELRTPGCAAGDPVL